MPRRSAANIASTHVIRRIFGLITLAGATGAAAGLRRLLGWIMPTRLLSQIKSQRTSVVVIERHQGFIDIGFVISSASATAAEEPSQTLRAVLDEFEQDDQHV